MDFSTKVRQMYQIKTPTIHKGQILRPNGLEDYSVINNNTFCNGAEFKNDSLGWRQFQFWQTRLLRDGNVVEILVEVTGQNDMQGHEWIVNPCHGDLRSEQVYGFVQNTMTHDELVRVYLEQLKSQIRELGNKDYSNGN